MSLGKKILAWLNSIRCFLFGHSATTICTKCGKFVDLKGAKKTTLEERINLLFSKKSKNKEPEYKGSLKLTPGLKKYAIDMIQNKLILVNYTEETGELKDRKGKVITDKNGNPKTGIVKRIAKYDPAMLYIDAMNDEVAIRKANEFLRHTKEGVKITCVSQ